MPLQLAVATLAFLAPLPTLSSQSSPPSFAQETTTVRSFDGRTMPGTWVTISVPERRATPNRTITVAALRLASTSGHPGNPIVFLMGGPGIPGSVIAPIPPYFSLFERLRELSDVIIVDQRGIGRSLPVLDCPLMDPLPGDAIGSPSRLVAAVRQEVTACAQRWRAAGAEPMAYNTIESADDVDAIRSALGAERVDLLAFSYGTRLALAYLHRHPAHVGRMVLQGVNGPGLVVKRPEMISRKLTRIGVLLAADSAWQGSTDLVTAAGKARARLTNSPATLTISNRRTGGQSTVSLGRDGLDALVALSLDDRRLPALLVSVAAGDVRLLTRFAEDAWNGFAAGTVGLMPRAVNCAADRPATRWATVRRESKRSLIGMPIDNAFLTDDFCRAVGYRSPPREFGKLLVSAVPALLLTGTLDATNPAENAAEVARYLSNAVRLDVENAAHEALTIPSVQDVVVDFFSGKDVRGRRVRADSPHFLTLDESLKAPVRRAP